MGIEPWSLDFPDGEAIMNTGLDPATAERRAQPGAVGRPGLRRAVQTRPDAAEHRPAAGLRRTLDNQVMSAAGPGRAAVQPALVRLRVRAARRLRVQRGDGRHQLQHALHQGLTAVRLTSGCLAAGAADRRQVLVSGRARALAPRPIRAAARGQRPGGHHPDREAARSRRSAASRWRSAGARRSAWSASRARARRCSRSVGARPAAERGAGSGDRCGSTGTELLGGSAAEWQRHPRRARSRWCSRTR